MPYIPQSRNTNNARFPTPPQKNIQVNSFPNDLIADGRNFYTQILFYNYSPQLQVSSSSLDAFVSNINSLVGGVNNLFSFFGRGIQPASLPPITQAGSGIILPIPKTINDNTVLTWNDESLITKMSSLPAPVGPAVAGLARAISSTSFMTGETINPFLFMFFQRQNFKEFVLKWVLTPSTPQESVTILNIVNTCKKAALPTKGPGGLELLYPLIAQVSLHPNELQQHLVFKPCAIISVQADYTGAGTPSFFKETKLPTVVTLSLSLKEIQLWDSTEITNNVLV